MKKVVDLLKMLYGKANKSHCCFARLLVVRGETGMNYICNKCRKDCDPVEDKEETL